ncbi:MAG: HD-GYP domain-containing protein, partial [Brevinematia bacterium]
KLLVVIISIMAIVFESSVFGAIYYKYLNKKDKIFGLFIILLPSLLPTSILKNFLNHNITSLIMLLFILAFNILIIYKTLDEMTNTYRSYTKIMEDFSRSVKNEEKLFRWFVVTLISLLEARDLYTKGHSERVAKYSYNLAKLLYNNTYLPNFIEIGGLLHDIGKIGVRDEVLFFPSNLTKEMRKEIESHTNIGKELLSSIDMFEDISDIAYLHHERLDGSGYPLGIKENDIPMYIRIVSIMDAFDAMNSARIYRKALDIQHIKKELITNSGTQFDKKLVDILINNINRVI